MDKKLDFIDSLRGYAILGVVLTHVAQLFTDLPWWFENTAANGARGVQLFFVVSAFTLMYSLHKKYTSKGLEVGDFFLRRFFRIAPAFYLALLLYSVVDLLTYRIGLSEKTNAYSVDMIFSTLTFTNLLNIDWLYSLVPGGWSISAEMLFYLTVPLLFFVVKTFRSSVYLLITSIVLSVTSTQLAIRFFSFSDGAIKAEYFFHWFPNQLPVFCFGIFLYHLWRNVQFKNSRQGHTLILVSLIGIFLISIWEFKGVTYYHNQILYGALFATLACGLANVKNSILINRLSIFIGKISFSMYLIHFFVIDVVELLLLNRTKSILSEVPSLIFIFIVTLLVSTGLSYLSFLFVEQKGINLGRKISNKMKAPRQEKPVEITTWQERRKSL